MTVTQIAALNNDLLVSRAWTLLTNVKSCGGASRKGWALAQRRLRAMGYRFFLGYSTESGARAWGILAPGQSVPEWADFYAVGVTLDHAAHKLGNGHACRGWRCTSKH